MAINYASKYSNRVDEAFKLSSLTEGHINNDYDWIGVKTVVVYGIPTVEEGAYTLTGSSRYGTASELQDTKQELTVSQDRAFTFTIDRMNNDSQMMTKNAGKALRRQIDEVSIPNVDIYRLNKVFETAYAGSRTGTTAVTKSNAYEMFLAGQTSLDNAKVPAVGRVAFCTASFINLLKQDSSFVKTGDDSQGMLVKGKVGEVDGCDIIKVPASYFAAAVSFVMMHKSCLISPKKLQDYKIHDNPPGINGWLVEGRNVYDAFILTNKAVATYAHVTGIGTGTATSVEGSASGKTQIDTAWTPVVGNKLVYKTDTTVAAPAINDDLSSWTDLTLDTDITATNGNEIRVAEVDPDGKARKVTAAITVDSKA